jgi:mannitol 2-dehydrogenase
MPVPPTSDAVAIPRPPYDRSAITTGIVHFGFGNFHRAHQAMYLDRLMSRGEAMDWGICGVGLLPADARMRDAMGAQDNLYTLVLKNPDGTLDARIIGSVHEYLFAPDDPEAVLARLVDPAVRIVSLTVTEGGYNIDRTTNTFDTSAPTIVADTADRHHPATVFGYIAEGLARRRAAGIAPFTVMSCDNLPGNGDITRQAITAFAALVDPELAAWIGSSVSFPNGMVDRITPTTTDADRALVAETFGVADAWPVMAEPFTQWVIEDEFPSGRPAFEHAGAQLVDDVRPYELIKLRLLNAGHQMLAYTGLLRGHRYAHEAMADDVVATAVRSYMDEARPTLQPVPDVDIDGYIAELMVRFGNPAIRDTLERLATDGSDRMPKFVLPAVRANTAAGRPVTWGGAAVACWKACYEDGNESGSRIEFIDAFAGDLRARAGSDDSHDFLRSETIFGDILTDTAFVAEYDAALAVLHSASLAALVAQLSRR